MSQIAQKYLISFLKVYLCMFNIIGTPRSPMYESYATPKQVRRTKSKNYSSHQWYTFSLGKWRKNQKKWAKQGKSQMNQHCKLNWLLKMLHALSLLSVKSCKIQVIQSFITTLLDLIWKVIVFHLF